MSAGVAAVELAPEQFGTVQKLLGQIEGKPDVHVLVVTIDITPVDGAALATFGSTSAAPLVMAAALTLLRRACQSLEGQRDWPFHARMKSAAHEALGHLEGCGLVTPDAPRAGLQ